MDAEEFIPLVIFCVIALRWLFRTGVRLANIDLFVCDNAPRVVYVVALVGCGIAFLIALNTVAAENVRDDAGVRFLFFAAWLAALAGATDGLGLLGIDATDEGIERNNPAARIVALALW